MDSNREINKRISTEVMGWVFDFQFPNCERYLMPDGNFVFTGNQVGYIDGADVGRVFNPAGDIKDAFEVVEKMVSKGWLFSVGSCDSKATQWLASFGRVLSIEDSWNKSDTPELAISLSALEAVKGQNDGYI